MTTTSLLQSGSFAESLQKYCSTQPEAFHKKYDKTIVFITNQVFKDYNKKGNEVSEKYCKEILELVELKDFPSHKEWGLHCRALVHLEKCFQKSATYTVEKAIIIFSKHISVISQLGFTPNLPESMIPYNFVAYHTPLGLAFKHRCPALTSVFIKLGADINFGYKCEDILKSKIQKLSPYSGFEPENIWLDYNASAFKKIHQDLTDQCMEMLVRHGSDPNRIEDRFDDGTVKLTPLLRAIADGDLTRIRSLVKAKADINLSVIYPYRGGSTPLLAACSAYRFKGIGILLELGADPFELNRESESEAAEFERACTDGFTAAEYARSESNIEQAQIIEAYCEKIFKEITITLTGLNFTSVLIPIVIDYLSKDYSLNMNKPKELLDYNQLTREDSFSTMREHRSAALEFEEDKKQTSSCRCTIC